MTIFDDAREHLIALKQAYKIYVSPMEALGELYTGERVHIDEAEENHPYLVEITNHYKDGFYKASISANPASPAARYAMECMYDNKNGLPHHDAERLFSPYAVLFDEKEKKLSVIAVSDEDAMTAIDTSIKNVVMLQRHMQEQCKLIVDRGQEYYQWVIGKKTPSAYSICYMLEKLFAPEKESSTLRHSPNFSTGYLERGGSYMPRENAPAISYEAAIEAVGNAKRFGAYAIRVKKTPSTTKTMQDILGIHVERGPSGPESGKGKRQR